LVVPEYGGELPGEDADDAAPVGEPLITDPEPSPELPLSEIQQQLGDLPPVRLSRDLVTEELDPARFFRMIVSKALDNTPVDYHRWSRQLRG